MPHIKEPYGVDFVVENNPVTEQDKVFISDIITYYKATGRVKKIKDIAGAGVNKKRITKLGTTRKAVNH